MILLQLLRALVLGWMQPADARPTIFYKKYTNIKKYKVATFRSLTFFFNHFYYVAEFQVNEISKISQKIAGRACLVQVKLLLDRWRER